MVIIMFENMENLKIISSLRQHSKKTAKIEARSGHGFVIRLSGSVRYDFADNSITVNEGEMIFIPQGTSYRYTTLSENSLYTSINFKADIENAEVRLYSMDNFYDADYISDKFSDMWKFGTHSDKYKCMSMFYDLVSYVANIEHSNYSDKHKYHIIDPAVEYLKKHIYNCNLKTDRLHSLCGISDTYFRKIFISRFRTNPQNYIISKRISHAKSIIDSGDYETIKEVAYMVGYSDPLYFGKAFKKMYGVNPSEANK